MTALTHLDEAALFHRANLTRFTHVCWAALAGTGWRFGGTYVAAGGEAPYRVDAPGRRIAVHDDGLGEGAPDSPPMTARLDRAAAHLVAAMRAVLQGDAALRRAMLREYAAGMIGEGVPGAQVLAVAYDCARAVAGADGLPVDVAEDVAAICTAEGTPATGLSPRLAADPAAAEPGALGTFTAVVARALRAASVPGPGEQTPPATLEGTALAMAAELARRGETPPGTLEGTALALASELARRGEGWQSPGRWIRTWVAAPRGGRSPEGR